MYAIIARFDSDFEEKIWEIWQGLRELGLSSYAYEKENHSPHLTLASFEKGDIGQIQTRLEDFLQDRTSITLDFSAIGSFLGSSMVTLNPVKTPELARFHTELHQKFSDILEEESHYSPDNWFPHLTIANRIEPIHFLAVYDYCLGKFQPLTTSLLAVEVIHITETQVEKIFTIDFKTSPMNRDKDK